MEVKENYEGNFNLFGYYIYRIYNYANESCEQQWSLHLSPVSVVKLYTFREESLQTN